MGCSHDRRTSSNLASPATNWGYRHEGEFRTILSYDCFTSSCIRIPYYSDPNIYYNGSPVGDKKDMNAPVIREHLPSLANFRSQVIPLGADPTQTLETSLSGVATGAQGQVFDIVAKEDIIVTNFAVASSAVAQNVAVAVYKKKMLGSVTSEDASNASLWDLVGHFQVNTQGQGSLTRLGPLGDMAPVTINAGQTQAFAIIYSDPSKNLNIYGRNGANINAEDQNLQVLTVRTLSYNREDITIMD